MAISPFQGTSSLFSMTSLLHLFNYLPEPYGHLGGQPVSTRKELQNEGSETKMMTWEKEVTAQGSRLEKRDSRGLTLGFSNPRTRVRLGVKNRNIN